MTATPAGRTTASARKFVAPLALAQFIASYAATNMNVAIGDIARDLDSSVSGLQTTITLFTLTMAALMIPGSKLTDIWGRKTCFIAGLVIYASGALLAALAPGLGLMLVGYSLLEGVGSALLIPPIYIMVTVAFTDLRTRARYFGVISGAGALGAAAGPLIGGLVTSAAGWRASFLLQVLVVLWTIALARHVADPPRRGPRQRFDLPGAMLSAAGLCFVVLGVLMSSTYGWFASRTDLRIGDTVVIPAGGLSPVWLSIGLGALTLFGLVAHLRAVQRAGRQPLFQLRLLRDRAADLGLGTQLVQWLTLQGSFFVISVYLQQARGYSAIATGLMLTPATAGILVASACAERMARRHAQRLLVIAGFVATAAGLGLLLALVRDDSGVASFVPGLLCVGLGIGTMLTASVNIVQSSFADADQGDISGISRSASNLGSSLGTALAGSFLVAADRAACRPFAITLGLLAGIVAIGLVLAVLIPRAGTRQ